MKRAYLHILSFIFLILLYPAANAQEIPADSLDERLAEYEALCGRCMDIKTVAASGNNVSKAEAQRLINCFVSANNDLRAAEEYMTVIQCRRFAAVRAWFATGVRSEVELCPMVPVLPQLADVCRMQSAPESGLAMQYSLLPTDEAVVASEPDKGNFYLLALAGVPNMSYGLMAGYARGRWGGYVACRSNFVSGGGRTSYICNSDGRLQDGGRFWAGGASRQSNFSTCAGGLFGLSEWLSLYAGAGYGATTLMWQDVAGEWAQVSDYTHKGLAIETGLLFGWRLLAFSAGVSTISFRTLSFTCGVGFRF